MKEWKKVPTIMSAIMLSVYLLTGCGNGKSTPSADLDTIFIKKDGTIEHMIIDRFDKDYYNIDELAVKAQEKIDRCSDGEDDIVLKSAEENDGRIVVEIIYKTGEAYKLFNNRQIFYGTVAEASEMGYSIRNIFSEDGTAMNDPEQIWENHIVIIQTKTGEKLDVNVYDKILYTSGNITCAGKNDAIITTEGEDMVSCIVFK